MARNRVLVVDDEKNQREIYSLILEDAGYDVATAQSGEQALRLARESSYDLVLTDYKMTGMDGLTLLSSLLRDEPSLIVVMMTAHGSVESVKDALRGGAFDYLEKPIDREQLLKVVDSALGQLKDIDDKIVGQSEPVERLKKMILKVAGSNSIVLIRGESGVGKELVARAIHKASPRAAEVFQAVNCAAFNENLLESELFGHEKGAFTGAHTQKKGQFEVADRGTLFLDEIGDLSVSMQAKILRALQEKEVMRVGGTKPTKVDARVIAATNRDLEAMVKEGRFREDLYYRLNIIPITIPPLRGRRDDILLLVDYFVAKHSKEANRRIRGLTASARSVVMNYAWPGNVRQLDSAIERAILLCECEEIDVEDLPIEIRQQDSAGAAANFKLPPEGISFEELEKSLIIQAMEQTGWNITRAAKLLGLSFRTLQYRLEKFAIKKPGKE
ncbi:MAG TPA: sigma-54 dependent transcriptional regulator [Blastocatellia bacterium]|nr:sigma-54 dependent transcriptional regulator [Blastocatellia bacterium]